MTGRFLLYREPPAREIAINFLDIFNEPLSSIVIGQRPREVRDFEVRFRDESNRLDGWQFMQPYVAKTSREFLLRKKIGTDFSRTRCFSGSVNVDEMNDVLKQGVDRKQINHLSLAGLSFTPISDPQCVPKDDQGEHGCDSGPFDPIRQIGERCRPCRRVFEHPDPSRFACSL
jgi:hypothetical protein